MRPGEIPGIRADITRRPYATILLVALSLIGFVVLAVVNRGDVAVAGPINGEWWRVATTPFLYENVWYELAAVTAIGVFGWLLERRHGPLVVIVLFALGGMGGAALEVVLDPNAPIAVGGNGGALALLVAWAVPDLLRARRHQEYDGDLLGAAVLAVLILLMPVATFTASWIAGATGVAVGLVLGLILARVHPD
jgi:membrane associated rhomboid family serine protease